MMGKLEDAAQFINDQNAEADRIEAENIRHDQEVAARRERNRLARERAKSQRRKF
jgi:hypothetical protein